MCYQLAEIDFVMTLEENCTVNCDSTNIAATLYDQVTSDLTESVSSGAFVADLISNAESDVNAQSLADVVVLPPMYEAYVLQTQSPTKSPLTKSPTNTSLLLEEKRYGTLTGSRWTKHARTMGMLPST
jgi:replicative superfamily II helicase